MPPQALWFYEVPLQRFYAWNSPLFFFKYVLVYEPLFNLCRGTRCVAPILLSNLVQISIWSPWMPYPIVPIKLIVR